MIDLSRLLVGDVSGVAAHLTANIKRYDQAGSPIVSANDSAMLLVEYVNGSHGTINVSNVLHIGDKGQSFSIVLHGMDGTLDLEANFLDGYRLTGAKRKEEKLLEIRIPDSFLKGVNQEDPVMDQIRQVFTEHPAGCRSFIDSIIEDRNASPSFVDGLRAQEVISAAFESDNKKQFVSLR